MENRNLIKWGFLILVAVIVGAFVYQMSYMKDVDERSSQSYIEGELARIEEENKEKKALQESLQKNPYVIEADKITAEERREYEDTLLSTEKGLLGEVDINDYMLDISEVEMASRISIIKNYIENCELKYAVEDAEILLETYNLVDFEEDSKYLKEVAKMECIVNAGPAEDCSNKLSNISDMKLFIAAFSMANQTTQAKMALESRSERVPVGFSKIVIDEPKEFSKNSMGLAHLMRSSSGYKGYKVDVTIDSTAYSYYLLVKNSTKEITLVKLLTSETASNLTSDNNYESYLNYIESENTGTTYGTQVRIN